jgi:mono/diheme cytochrome c family protein
MIVIAIGGCASSGSIAPPVTPAMVSAASGASAEILNEGRRIFAGPCTACHAPDPVSRYSLVEWRAVVDEMAPRTKLDAGRRGALLAYISAAKTAGPSPLAR